MGRKANEVPAAHLTGDEQELSCFRNTNLAVEGAGGWRTISRWVHNTVLRTMDCQVSCVQTGLSSFFICVLLRRFLWLFLCSVRIFFSPFPFRYLLSLSFHFSFPVYLCLFVSLV